LRPHGPVSCGSKRRATNAYLHVDPKGALTAAKEADLRRAAGEPRGPLDGVPVALKDNMLVAGLPTTCASHMLEGFIAPYDATVVRKLKAAGAVLLGKLNMDEFAMGSSSEHSHFGPVQNPWDPARVPGGSSGGSAAAVAAGSAFAALGTDTGGSIRQPAAFCGVVGCKPTYSRVSRYGVVAFASSLDQVGPLSKDVTDCALMLEVIAGHDEKDSTSAAAPVPSYSAALKGGVRGLRLGLPQEYFIEGIDPEVRAAIDAAVATWRGLGAEVVAVSLPTTDYAIACYYLLCTAEASSNLARFDGVRYGRRAAGDLGLREMYGATRAAGFGQEVKRRIMLGTYVLSAGYYDAYYKKAQAVRTLVQRDFAAAFATCDALVTPTTPTTAFALGERLADPMTMYLADVFTVGANIAGLPGLSLPCGQGSTGLPIGVQILGPHFAEATLLRIGRALELACGEDRVRRLPPRASARASVLGVPA